MVRCTAQWKANQETQVRIAASHLKGNKQYPRQYDNPIIYDTPPKTNEADMACLKVV